MRQIQKVLLSFLLLTLFATYQVGITMFTHIHYVNGVMITHSHPNKGKHAHSKTAIVIIDRLAAFHTLEADVHTDFSYERPLIYIVPVQDKEQMISSTCLQVLSLRAPPARWA